MADISSYLDEMRVAKLGSEMRMPIAGALNELFTEGKNVTTLANHTSDYYAKQSDLAKLIPVDTYPSKDSTKLITSNAIRAIAGDIEHIDLEDDEDEWLT